MSAPEKVVIGNAELWHGDCREVLPLLPRVDAVITDPPYSERTHLGHDAVGNVRAELGYAALSGEQAASLAGQLHALCDGWIVWMTDHTLAPVISNELARCGRYVFAPLPYFHAGRSVRLTGDGPCSWTDWVVVARTKAQSKWGTLPGGYVAGPGWNDKARMGGKPTLLMDALVGDYSKPGQTVLDTHMGAGTTGVSCMTSWRKFIGCEIDRPTFELACERIANAQAQGQMFAPEPIKQEQEQLL
jgi:hypothetical protein